MSKKTTAKTKKIKLSAPKFLVKNPLYLLTAVILVAAGTLGSVKLFDVFAAELPDGFTEYTADHVYYLGEAAYAQNYYYGDDYRNGYLNSTLLSQEDYAIGGGLSPAMLVAGSSTYDDNGNHLAEGTTLEDYASKNISRMQGTFSYELSDYYAYIPVYIAVGDKKFVYYYDTYSFYSEDDSYDAFAKAEIGWSNLYWNIDNFVCDGQKLNDYLKRIIVHRDYEDAYQAFYTQLLSEGKSEEEARQQAEDSVINGDARYDFYSKVSTLAGEYMTAATLKTEYNGTVYKVADLSMLDLQYIQAQNNEYNVSINVHWTEGTVHAYSNKLAMAYNSEEGFSFTPESMNVAYSDYGNPSFVRFTDTDGTVIRDCPLTYGGGADGEPKTYFLWCTSDASICAVSIPDEMLFNEYGSNATSVKLPVSISMLYDFSRYPADGITDDANLDGQRTTVDNTDYDYALSDSFWSNTFTLGGGDDSALPTFRPPGYTGENPCALEAWRVKDVASSKLGSRASVSLNSVKKYITYTFNSTTGFYEGEFRIEPLFVDCYITLTYYANNSYSYGYCYWDDETSVTETYIYQYKDDDGGILSEPKPPTVTVKKPENVTYTYEWSDEEQNLAGNHYSGEEFLFWSAEDIKPADENRFDSDNGEVYATILENYSGATYTAGAQYTTLTGDVKLYGQWMPLRYHLTYDYQSPSGDPDDVAVINQSWSSTTDITDIFIPQQICCKDKALCTPAVSYNYDMDYGKTISNFQADSNGTYYGSVKLKTKDTSPVQADWRFWSDEPDGEYNVYRYYPYQFQKGEGAYDYYATVYGIWVQDKYNLVYDANTADSVTDLPQGVSVNAPQLKNSYMLSTQKPKRTNYAFDGWYLTADATGDEVTAVTYDQAAAQQSDGTLDNGDTITVYAKWVDARSVTYHANVAADDPIQPTGEAPTDDTIYRTTWKATVKGNTGNLARTGYVFGGWNTAADGSGTNYEGNGTEEILMTDNVNLYAQWIAIAYRLTYQPNAKKTTPGNMPAALPDFHIGGFTESNGQYTVSLTGSPQSFGYTFKGWGKASDAQTPDAVTLVALDDFQAVEGGDNLYECNVYAIWEKVPFTVTYHANKDRFINLGTVAFGNSGKEVPDGVSLDIDNFTYDSDNAKWYWEFPDDKLQSEGFTFLGWNPDKTATEGRSGRRLTAETDFDSENHECTLYAIWQENAYALRYEAGEVASPTGMPAAETDLVYVSSEDSTKNVKNGKSISSEQPVHDGYVFKNWKITYTDSEGSHELNLNSEATIPFAAFAAGPKDEDGKRTVTAVAQWTKIAYHVVYHDNSASIDNTTVTDMPYENKDCTETFYITAVSDNQYTLNPNSTPAADDYLFQGWATSANATDTVTKIAFSAATTSYDVYAVWKEDLYTLNFYDGDTKLGKQTEKNSVVNTAGGMEITQNNPTAPAGKKFAGWSLTKGSDTAEYKKGQSVSKDKFTDKVANVYAVWKDITYRLNFNDGDTELEHQTAVYAQFHEDNGITITYANPNKTGSDFLGWSKTKGGTSLDYQNGDRVPDTEFGTDNTATVYAVWKPITYTLHFFNGTEEVAHQTVDYTSFTTTKGITIDQTDPSKNGHNFLGWAVNTDGSGDKYQNDDKVPDTLFGANRSANVYAAWEKIHYTITYDPNKGEGDEFSETVAHGGDHTTWDNTKKGDIEPYTREGYKLLGWDTDKDATTATYALGAKITGVTANLKLYAVWKVNTHTITYDANGGTGDEFSETVAHGGDHTTWDNTKKGDITPYTHEGYKLLGWNTDAAATSASYALGQKIDSVTANLKLYAVWEEDTYTLHFKDGTEDLGSQTAKYTAFTTDGGIRISEDDQAKDGFAFLGWANTDNATTAEYQKGELVPADKFTDKSATVYAVWKEDTYTLHFYDGDTKLDNSQTAKYTAFTNDGGITISRDDPSKDGYNFLGWANAKGATTADYQKNGLVPKEQFTEKVANVYAVWAKVTYTITYNANGGIGDEFSETLAQGSEYTVWNNAAKRADHDPYTKAGHTLTGWNTKTDGTGTAYTLGQKITGVTANLKLYAVWEEDTYTLHFKDGTEDLGSQTAKYTAFTTDGGIKITKDDQSKDGFAFLGWSHTDNATTAEYQKGELVPEGKFTDKSATVYAVWKEDTYTLNFYDGDTKLDNQTAKYTAFTNDGGITISRDNPSKDGYNFLGWANTKGATTADYQKNGLVPKEQFTEKVANVYAVWTKVTHTITYNANGGEGDEFSETVAQGSEYTVWNNAAKRADHDPYTKAGHTLTGWNTKTDGTGTAYTLGQKITGVTANLKLYAVWKEDTYTLHFKDGTEDLGSQTAKYTAFTTDGGIKISEDDQSKDGFAFLGWANTDNATTAEYQKGALVPADKFTDKSATVYAVWKEDTYTLYFYDGDTKLDSQTVKYTKFTADGGITITRDDPSKDGYNFLGWANTKGATTADYQKNGLVPKGQFTEKVANVYAVWAKVTHTITYNANGGTGDEFSETVAQGSEYTVWNNAAKRADHDPYTKAGHTLTGWNTKADGSGTAYTLGQKITGVTANLKLYAVWKEDTYTLHFKDGTEDLGSQTAKYTAFTTDGGIKITKDDQSKDGFAFLGWANTDNATTAEYQKGELVPEGKFTDKSATVYAVWKEDTYTLYFYDGDTKLDSQTAKYTKFTADGGITITRDDPSKDGYNFLGWANTKGATTADYQKNGLVPKGQFTEKVANVYAVWAKVTHTITYNANGGTGDEFSETVAQGSEYTVWKNDAKRAGHDPYTKAGHTLTGWNTKTDGSGTAYALGQKIDGVTKSMKLYAVWKEDTYTLYFKDGIEDLGSQMAKYTAFTTDGGIKITRDNPSKDGYNFLGWANTDGATTADYQKGALVPADKFTDKSATVYAVWKEDTYTLNFYDGDTKLDNQTAKYTAFTNDGGIKITRDDPSKDGYNFLGWANTKGATTADYQKNGLVPKEQFTEKVANVYAVWAKVTHTITYNANGGTGDEFSETVAQGSEYTVWKNDAKRADHDPYTKAGHTLTGWNTKADGSGTAYTLGQKITGVTANLKLYAVWKEDTYTLYFKDGTEDLGSQTAKYTAFTTDGGIKISEDDQSKDGFAFLGWANTDNATTAEYQKGELVPADKFTDKSATVYAVWKEDTYTLNFYDGDTKLDSQTAKYTKFTADGGITISRDNPSKDGYNFLGWANTKGATTADYQKNGLVPKEQFTEKVANVYAVWAKVTYTITYNANGGTGDEFSETVAQGSEYTVWKNDAKRAGHDPYTKAGHTLTGWNTKADGSGTAYALGQKIDSVTANLKLYAVWKEDTYTLYFKDGTEDLGSQTAKYTAFTTDGGIKITRDNPSKDGYNFLGWANTDNATSADYQKGALVPADKFTDKSATVYAVWKKKSYAISYDPNSGTGDAFSENVAHGGTYTVWDNAAKRSDHDPYTKAGHTLTGWNTKADGSGTTYTLGQKIDGVTANLTLYAVWKEDTYTLYFKDGDTKLGNQPAKYTDFTQANGIKITQANPSKSGYTFQGWTTTKDGKTADYSKGNIVPTEKFTDKSATVYAVWKEIPPTPVYTVHYVGNGKGTVNVRSNSLPGDKKLTAEQLEEGYKLTGERNTGTAPLSNNSYDFVCWCLTANHEAANVRSEVSIADFNEFAEDNVLTMYAIWVTHIDVTYQKGYSKRVEIPAEAVDGAATDPTDPVVSDSDAAEASVNQIFAFELNERTLLYRVRDVSELDVALLYEGYQLDYWQVIKSEGTITHFIGATADDGNVPQSGAGEGAEPSDPGEPETEIIEVGGRLYPNYVVDLTGNVTLEAYWSSKKACTLTYHANGGTPAEAVPNKGNPIDCYVGDAVTIGNGSGLTKGELVFRYWSTTANDGAGSKRYNKGDSLTLEKDTHLYAIYHDAPDPGASHFTVTYDANGGTGNTPQDNNRYYGGESVTVASKGNLTKTDCTFVEWNTERDGSGTGYFGDGTDSFTMPQHNVTLYAVWMDKDGVLIYDSPYTGDSLTEIWIAVGAGILALSAMGIVLVRKRSRRAA